MKRFLSLGPFLTVLVTAFLSSGQPAVAETRLGLAAYNRGDFAAAANLWRAEADAGDAEAAYLVGVLYRHGVGVRRDKALAVAYLEKAKAEGHAQAAAYLTQDPQFKNRR